MEYNGLLSLLYLDFFARFWLKGLSNNEKRVVVDLSDDTCWF